MNRGFSKLGERAQSVTVRGLAAIPDGVLRRVVGRPINVDGQELHPEAQLALRLLSISGAPRLQELTAAQARARVAQDAHTFQGPKIEIAEVRSLEVPGKACPLRTRLYVPHPSQGPDALVVYFHGGGFVVCDLETHDNPCRLLALRSGARVLSIDYRLAPEARFPAAVDDALAAFHYAAEHCAELGASSERIGVAGDSAGGNLAAAVAQLARSEAGPRPAFQLLFYPWLDLAHKRSSYALFRDGFYLTESDLDWYGHHYLARSEEALDPRCSPLLTEDLQGLPPAYIATAGFDPLRDDGEEYANRLRAAGVPVALRRHAGLIHGFVNTVAVGHVGRDAVLEAAGALQLGLAG